MQRVAHLKSSRICFPNFTIGSFERRTTAFSCFHTRACCPASSPFSRSFILLASACTRSNEEPRRPPSCCPAMFFSVALWAAFSAPRPNPLINNIKSQIKKRLVLLFQRQTNSLKRMCPIDRRLVIFAIWAAKHFVCSSSIFIDNTRVNHCFENAFQRNPPLYFSFVASAFSDASKCIVIR